MKAEAFRIEIPEPKLKDLQQRLVDRFLDPVAPLADSLWVGRAGDAGGKGRVLDRKLQGQLGQSDFCPSFQLRGYLDQVCRWTSPQKLLHLLGEA